CIRRRRPLFVAVIFLAQQHIAAVFGALADVIHGDAAVRLGDSGIVVGFDREMTAGVGSCFAGEYGSEEVFLRHAVEIIGALLGIPLDRCFEWAGDDDAGIAHALFFALRVGGVGAVDGAVQRVGVGQEFVSREGRHGAAPVAG